MISTGAKSISESIEQIEHTVEILANEKFIENIKIEPKVQNIVARTNIDRIDLNRMASILTKIIFEPDQFPGAIYKSPNGPTCTACNRAAPGTTAHAQFLPLKCPNLIGDRCNFL